MYCAISPLAGTRRPRPRTLQPLPLLQRQLVARTVPVRARRLVAVLALALGLVGLLSVVVRVASRRHVPAPGGGFDTELQLTSALSFTHIGVTEIHHGHALSMRAEVALYLRAIPSLAATPSITLRGVDSTAAHIDRLRMEAASDDEQAGSLGGGGGGRGFKRQCKIGMAVVVAGAVVSV